MYYKVDSHIGTPLFFSKNKISFMKDSLFPKEILVVIIGILLIVGVMFFTLFRSNTKIQNLPETSSENLQVTQFFDQVDYVQADKLITELHNSGLVIIDIRDKAYFDLSHVPGSISTTPDTAVEAFTSYKANPQKIVLVDSEGQTPQLEETIKTFRDHNIKNIRVLSGGYSAWNTHAYPTVSWGDPESPTDLAKVRSISPENVQKVINDKEVVFLDVRSAEDYLKEHREGSLNVPFEELESSSDKIPKMQMLIVYGTTPIDSFRAGVRLFDMGYNLAYTVVGGYIDIK